MTYFLLYLFMIAVYIGSNFALESVVNKLLFAERYKELNELLDEAEFTEEEEDKLILSMMKGIGIYLLTCLALLLFAVLPALTKGGVMQAILLGVVFYVVVEAVTLITNIKQVRLKGVTHSISHLLCRVTGGLITTAAAYFLGVLILK